MDQSTMARRRLVPDPETTIFNDDVPDADANVPNGRRKRKVTVPGRHVDHDGNELFCEVCYRPQISAPNRNVTCENGHGGVHGLTQDETNKAVEKAKKAITIEESVKLQKELERLDAEEQHLRARTRFDFEVSNRRESPIRGDVQRVVEKVFINDIGPIYEKLEAELCLGDDHSDRGSLSQRLGRAAENMRLAHRIYVTAKVEKEAWETRNAVIHGAMWLEASKALQEEKDNKQRNKQITDGDIKAKAAVIFGDEWHSQETERRRVKEMVDSLANLVDCWKKHHDGLEALYGKSR